MHPCKEYDIISWNGVFGKAEKQMKKSLEERVKSRLLKIGKKNGVCRVLILPVLAVCMLFFHAARYCRGNGKRFAMLSMTVLLFVVYSSCSFPIFITSADRPDDLYGMENIMSDIVLAEEEELDIGDVELLDDEDVLDDYEYDETSHGLSSTDKYNAEEILRSTENRESSPDRRTEKEGMPEGEVDISQSFSKDDWRLVLINKQHSIPEDYTFELDYITGNLQCDERIIDDLRDMLQAALEDDVNLEIRSPYRDEARQEMLFGRKINLYMSKGMSYVEAYRLGSQIVMVPGASEHQIGLALDIVSDKYDALDEGFGETEAGIWLAENSYRYGFILRYPLGEEYITGVEYEPWHFRYVGVDAATVITQRGITLEEFWEELE